MNLETVPRLFLACLQTELSDEAAVSLTQLTAEEWEQLLALSIRQRVGPLLYQRLKVHKLEATVPPPPRERWRAVYYSNAARNLRLYDELGTVLSLLQESNIPVIVLKGAMLAETVYSHPALRFMNDIDILVARDHLEPVVEKLTQGGYSTPVHCAVEECFSDKHNHHWPRLGKADAVAGIEVHWSITTPDQYYHINMDELWARALPVTLAGQPALRLCPEDLLLHLCLHLTHQHLFVQGINPLCDIDKTVRCYQDTLNWEQIAERASTWGWASGVYLSLYLAAEMFNTPIPETALRRLQPINFSKQIADAAILEVLSVNRPEQGEVISPAFSQFYKNRAPTKKIGLFLQSWFLPPQSLAKMYGLRPNSNQVYLYYARRLIDLLARYSGKAWRLRRGESEIVARVQRRILLEEWLK